MKKDLEHILAALGGFVLVMLVGVFIAWEPNFAKWDAADRFICILMALIAGVISYKISKDE